ncbi:MAG: TIM44-like domain-containing protein [Bacilli bacterium]|nr:TIM44-like domain-containing protein [Bacilli bacterium]
MSDNELISKFSNIYIMLLYSIMTNDIDRVKHFLSNELYLKYKSIVENHIKNHETQMYDELNVYKINIESIEVIDNKEVVTVRLISRYMDYIMDNETKKIKSGVNTHRIEKTNILTFEKNVGEVNKKVIHTCPNCGANLDINYNGICSYCNQSVDLKEDYILVDIN